MSNINENNTISSLLIKTANFAAIKHVKQIRKDGITPYINHPIGVANYLVTVGGINDIVTLQAALLHDTVEDTDTTLSEIEEEFGAEVSHVVNEVTDDKQLTYDERKRLQIEHASGLSLKAKLVKMADKLYNLTDLTKGAPIGWSEERVQQYYEWSGQVIRGLKGVNQPLESELRKVLAKRGVSFD